MVQLKPIQPAVQEVHHPSVRRQVSDLQLGEHSLEQFAPKYPFIHAKSREIYTQKKTDRKWQIQKKSSN